MFVKCPECRAVSRPGYSFAQSLSSTYFCPHCLKLVRVKPVYDEVKSTSSVDSVAKAERKKILVVDDAETIRKIAEELLTSAGYHVLKAQDGEQALVLAHNERPNLIVLDLVMPGLAGYEVVQGIRRNPFITDTPILIMSGFVFTKEIHDSLREYEVTDFMSKSQMTTSLVSRVQYILSNQAHQVA